MSYEDNWDSFINDDSDQETKTNDSWDSFEDEDFEDVLSVDDEISSEIKINTQDDYEYEEKPAKPVRHIERVRDYEEDEKPQPEKKKSSSGNIVTILIIAFALLIVGALVFLGIKLFGGSSEPDATEETVPTTAYWQQEDAGDISTLINSYYSARVLQDTYTLSQILDPSVTVDEATLASEANVIEGYQNVTCYTSDGINQGEWAVYVSYAIKFKNIATPAPGLVATYVKTDESGNMRLIPWENVQKDEHLSNYIAAASDCDAINQLASAVYDSYVSALESDADLKSYVEAITGTTAAPADPTEPVEPSEPTQGGDTPATEVTEPTQATAEPTQATQGTTHPSADEGDFTPCDTCMYITKDGVNMRKSPNTDAEVIKGLAKGTYMQVMAKSSSWYKVCDLSDGKIGYVSSQFFSNDKPK